MRVTAQALSLFFFLFGHTTRSDMSQAKPYPKDTPAYMGSGRKPFIDIGTSGQHPAMRRFDDALLHVLTVEGGYSQLPPQYGGKQKFGISEITYPSIDIESLTFEEARRIYWRDWWTPNQMWLLALPDNTRKHVFAALVHLGPRRTVVLLQKSLNALYSANMLQEDGLAGEMLVGALHNARKVYRNSELDLVLRPVFTALLVEEYHRIDAPQYIAGWIKRAYTK